MSTLVPDDLIRQPYADDGDGPRRVPRDTMAEALAVLLSQFGNQQRLVVPTTNGGWVAFRLDDIKAAIALVSSPQAGDFVAAQPRAAASPTVGEENALLRHLVGCAIEALSYFHADDGHAELIRAGIAAEYTKIVGATEEADES